MMERISYKTYLWIFIVAITSLGSAQHAIHETKQRTLNLCEEQVLVEETYKKANKTCSEAIEYSKQSIAAYEKLELVVEKWIKECKQ